MIIDLNKASHVADELKKQLNEREIIHLIKLLYNDLSTQANLSITNILRKTGHLLTHCTRCQKTYSLEKEWLAHLHYQHGISEMKWDPTMKSWMVVPDI